MRREAKEMSARKSVNVGLDKLHKAFSTDQNALHPVSSKIRAIADELIAILDCHRILARSG